MSFAENASDRFIGLLYKPLGIERFRLRSNEDYENIIPSLVRLLDTTNNRAKILTTNMPHEVYQHPDIVETFNGLLNRGVNIHILHTQSIDPRTRTIPDTINFEGEGQVILLPTKVFPESHIWTIDGNSVFEEINLNQDRIIFIEHNALFLAKAHELDINKLILNATSS